MKPPDTRGPAPLTGLVAAVVLLAVVVAGVLLTRPTTAEPGADGTAPTPPATPAGRPATGPTPGGAAASEAQRSLAASRALIALERAVRTGREDLFDRVYDTDRSAAGVGGADVFTSLRRLPLSTYSMRYLGEVARTGRTWRADVAVQWGLRRVDRRSVTSEIEVTFTQAADGTRIVEMAPARGERTPVWLLGTLQVERAGTGLVLSTQPPLTDAVVGQARKAVRDVRAVLRGWDGGLVVVLPETTEQLEGLLAARPGTYDTIAAVTASADGSGDPAAPVRVLLNPPVFSSLGPVAGQVVLSHEATHAATGATFRDMPLWLVEGFADYVALAGEPVPVDVAAGQALDRVRRSGPPDSLPGKGDFDTSAHGLGASYEAAWLACRLIAEQYGEERLLRFHARVARTGDAGTAFRSVLGTSRTQFTADWRAYLRELAG